MSTTPTVTGAQGTRPTPELGELVYRFEGQLGEPYPLGLFDDGIRFHNQFEGRIVEGPFAGGRIFGLDQFLLRPDGIGEIVAPEVVDDGTSRLALEVRGRLVPPAGAPALPLAAVLEPGFAFPDAELRVTASATVATVASEHAALNGAVLVVEGTVNMATGAMDVSAYRVDPATG